MRSSTFVAHELVRVNAAALVDDTLVADDDGVRERAALDQPLGLQHLDVALEHERRAGAILHERLFLAVERETSACRPTGVVVDREGDAVALAGTAVSSAAPSRSVTDFEILR